MDPSIFKEKSESNSAGDLVCWCRIYTTWAGYCLRISKNSTSHDQFFTNFIFQIYIYIYIYIIVVGFYIYIYNRWTKISELIQINNLSNFSCFLKNIIIVRISFFMLETTITHLQYYASHLSSLLSKSDWKLCSSIDTRLQWFSTVRFHFAKGTNLVLVSKSYV